MAPTHHLIAISTTGGTITIHRTHWSYSAGYYHYMIVRNSEGERISTAPITDPQYKALATHCDPKCKSHQLSARPSRHLSPPEALQDPANMQLTDAL